MKLNEIWIKNFKGLKDVNMAFLGHNATITAENSTGKTSVYDAFLWLLFGKDSAGKSDFEVRPLDENNQPLKEVVIFVAADIEINDTVYHLEKTNKKSTNGFSNSFKIDKVPKKAGEFASFIESIATEEKFKLCSNLTSFNELHWTERRKILLDLAGNIDKPIGFESLLAEMGNRSLDDYKKVISDRVKLLTDEQKGISPRIDEQQNTINDSSISDGLMTFEEERESLNGEMATIDSEYHRIEKQNAARAIIIEQVSKLTNQRDSLAVRLQSDKSHVAGLSEQIAKKRQAIAAMQTDLKAIEERGKQLAMAETGKKNELDWNTKEIERLRAESAKLKTELETLALQEVENKCYACGQLLPQDKFKENIDSKKKKIFTKQQEREKVVESGKAQRVKLDKLTAELAEISAQVTNVRAEYADQKALCNDVKAQAEAEIKQLEEQIASAGVPDFTQDLDWQALNNQIKAIEIPELQTTEHLAQQRREYQEQLNKCNKALAQADNIKKAQARITELQERERQIGIDVTKLKGTLAQIEDYIEQESLLICQAVNGQFERVSFKLFDTQINGNKVPCCETLYNGVPYSDMSRGQKIIAGIDIINRLSLWYNLDIPLFIDNAESLTIPYSRSGQTVELRVSKDKKLKLEIKE